jgi:hypothetical protein
MPEANAQGLMMCNGTACDRASECICSRCIKHTMCIGGFCAGAGTTCTSFVGCPPPQDWEEEVLP